MALGASLGRARPPPHTTQSYGTPLGPRTHTHAHTQTTTTKVWTSPRNPTPRKAWLQTLGNTSSSMEDGAFPPSLDSFVILRIRRGLQGLGIWFVRGFGFLHDHPMVRCGCLRWLTRGAFRSSPPLLTPINVRLGFLKAPAESLTPAAWGANVVEPYLKHSNTHPCCQTLPRSLKQTKCRQTLPRLLKTNLGKA